MYDPDTRECSRFSLERCTQLPGGRLVPYRMADPDYYLPHPIDRYVYWFNDDIPSIASYAGLEPDELRRMFCSADVHELAQAYLLLADYHGMENLDSYPIMLTRKEARERYAPYL